MPRQSQKTIIVPKCRRPGIKKRITRANIARLCDNVNAQPAPVTKCNLAAALHENNPRAPFKRHLHSANGGVFIRQCQQTGAQAANLGKFLLKFSASGIQIGKIVLCAQPVLPPKFGRFAIPLNSQAIIPGDIITAFPLIKESHGVPRQRIVAIGSLFQGKTRGILLSSCNGNVPNLRRIDRQKKLQKAQNLFVIMSVMLAHTSVDKAARQGQNVLGHFTLERTEEMRPV